MAEVIRAPSDYPAGATAIWPWRPSPLRQAAWLAGFVAVCFAAVGFGGAITATTVEDWYQTLAKPEWTPPDRLFGPVWTLHYLMMGVAAWVWLVAGSGCEVRVKLHDRSFSALTVHPDWSGTARTGGSGSRSRGHGFFGALKWHTS